MTNFEIFLIVGFVSSPILALLFILPKKLKKEKTSPPTTEYKPEPKVEEKKEEPKSDFESRVSRATVETDDFKDYITNKRNKISILWQT